MKQVTFVTGNAGKLREVQSVVQRNASLEVKNQDLDLPEIQGTTQEIARHKVQSAAKIVKGPCLTEDTALCFEALGQLPGPYIKYFMKALGHSGLNTMLDGFETRKATALCTFAYCESPESEPVLFEGRTQGRIVSARGDNNFGWDPIFEVEGTGKTFAEMTVNEKNAVSHRGKALKALEEFLAST